MLSNVRNDLLKYANVDTLFRLFDPDRWEVGGIMSATGANDNSITGGIRIKYGVLVKSGKTYQFVNPTPGMLYIICYNIDGTFNSTLESLPAGTTFNRSIPVGVRFIRIWKIADLSSIPEIKITEVL